MILVEIREKGTSMRFLLRKRSNIEFFSGKILIICTLDKGYHRKKETVFDRNIKESKAPLISLSCWKVLIIYLTVVILFPLKSTISEVSFRIPLVLV